MHSSGAVERFALAGARLIRERPGRALAWSGLAGRLAGPAVVAACIALPVMLGMLSVAVEAQAADGYIHALPSAAPAVAARAKTRTGLLDEHFYFVNGCVAAPRDCVSPEAGHWGEYYAELRRLYEQAAQSQNTSARYAPGAPFDSWAAEHTHFIISPMAPEGAHRIARALAENKSDGEIHIIGTSAGGAAVFTYLSQAMRGDVPFDGRIASVMTVDSPLGYQSIFTSGNMVSALLNGLQASSMRTDVQSGLGRWARAAHIAMLTVDTRQDIVGYSPLPGIPNDSAPVYPQPDTPPMPAYVRCASMPCRLVRLTDFLDVGSTWHIYTGSHMANSAREFIDRYWR